MNVIYSSCTAHPIKQFKIHTHTSWEIILNMTGTNRSIIQDSEYDISADDILVIPPNTPHGSVQREGEFTDIYVSAHDLDFDGYFVTHDYDGCINSLMHLIMKTLAEHGEGYERIADGLLDVICTYIKRFRNMKCKYNFISDFKNVLFGNLSNEQFDIQSAIKLTGFNSDYFRRCFVGEIGLTPLQYLTQLRINESKKLLVNTNLSITEITRQCGFTDIAYFSRKFRQQVGVSPSEFRKSNLTESDRLTQV